jgi:hypothetical protein
MLREYGFVVFETGNLGDVKEKYYQMFAEFQFPDHLFFFSEGNLRELLQRSGFAAPKVYRYSIVPLLFIFDGLNKIAERIKPLRRMKKADEDSKSKRVSSGFADFDARRFGLRSLMKNAYNYLYYFVRYKMGRVMPKKERPQTLIVVGQKASEATGEAR